MPPIITRCRFIGSGTDQGLLSAPVPLTNLEIAPAERADLVIDFSQHRGAQVMLKSDAFVVMQFRVSSQKGTTRVRSPRLCGQ